MTSEAKLFMHYGKFRVGLSSEQETATPVCKSK